MSLRGDGAVTHEKSWIKQEILKSPKFVKTEEKSAFGGPGIATDHSSLDQYDDNSLICLGHHGQMLPISG